MSRTPSWRVAPGRPAAPFGPVQGPAADSGSAGAARSRWPSPLRLAPLWFGALTAAALLGSCRRSEPATGSAEPMVQRLAGRTMGTTWSVLFVGTGALHELQAARSAVEAALSDVDAVFSTWRDDSELARCNDVLSEPGAARVEVEISTELAAVTRLALQLAELSDGAFDPTAAPLLELYGFTGDGERRVPSAAELAAVRTAVGFEALRIERRAGGQSVLVRDGAQPRSLELSSVAKGHGVDRVSAALLALDHQAHFVEIGGEVRVRGSKPGGEPWRVGIERPASDSPAGQRLAASVVELADGALATSGSYRNYVEAEAGARVHHVLDARTGRNADHDTVSVSVLAPTCASADGWATLLLVLGAEDGAELMAARRAAGESLAALFLRVPGGGTADRQGFDEVAVGWPPGGD